MRAFNVFLVGADQPIQIDLPFDNINDLADAASRARFLAGCMTAPDEDGVFLRVMVATNRIHCAFELD